MTPDETRRFLRGDAPLPPRPAKIGWSDDDTPTNRALALGWRIEPEGAPPHGWQDCRCRERPSKRCLCSCHGVGGKFIIAEVT